MKPKPENTAMSLIEDSEFHDIYPFTFDDADSYLPEEPAHPAPRELVFRHRVRQQDLKWNVMTVLVWLLMAFSVMAFVSIYTNPYSALNPFQPGAPTLVAAVVIPTATEQVTADPNQPTILAPVAITSTVEPPTPTPTVTATVTPIPTETATPGPSPTPTIHSLYPFIQRGETKSIDGATFHSSDECYLWVAGQAYDLQGAPMVGITVMLGGTLDYKYINQLSLTGTALQYGQAGYEFIIAEHPVKSKEAVWVQLFDQAMIPLSNRIPFDTYDDCSQNLILINFRQVR